MNSLDNPFVKYRIIFIKVLVFFNLLELFGALITTGDWLFIVFTNLVFLISFLILEWKAKIYKLTNIERRRRKW